MILEPLRTKGLNAPCVFESQSCVIGSSPEQAFSQQILRTHEKHTCQNESRTAKTNHDVKSNQTAKNGPNSGDGTKDRIFCANKPSPHRKENILILDNEPTCDTHQPTNRDPDDSSGQCDSPT